MVLWEGGLYCSAGYISARTVANEKNTTKLNFLHKVGFWPQRNWSWFEARKQFLGMIHLVENAYLYEVWLSQS